jgi:hypothetical protein
MKRFTSLAVLVVLCLQARAANVPIQGADKPIPKDSFAELSVLAEKGDKVSWDVFPVPAKLVDDGAGKCYFLGPRNRKYEVRVYVVNFDTKKFDRGAAVVTFDKAVPDEPEPDPDEEDIGAATFLSKVKAAYRDETDADKTKLVPEFVKLYRRTAESVDSAKTREDVFLAMTKHGTDLKLTGRLTVLQKAVGAELSRRLPWKAGPDHDQPITEADRKKAREAMSYVADTLAKLKL